MIQWKDMIMTSQLKLIGKLLNIVEEHRFSYIEGIVDYLDINGIEDSFVIRLYNHIAEHGAKSESIQNFYDKTRF